uniref:Uncharacterized protein n=1 Tax=Physcomitrium patens TaxID=3218 RepID=A0A2K1L441_PHYPA|nr:hypothetical protein PHYPA_003585 [Physcomitrium patens]
MLKFLQFLMYLILPNCECRCTSHNFNKFHSICMLYQGLWPLLLGVSAMFEFCRTWTQVFVTDSKVKSITA